MEKWSYQEKSLISPAFCTKNYGLFNSLNSLANCCIFSAPAFSCGRALDFFLGSCSYQVPPQMQTEESFGETVSILPNGGSFVCEAEWSYKLSLLDQADTDSGTGGTPHFPPTSSTLAYLGISKLCSWGDWIRGTCRKGLEEELMGVGLSCSWWEWLIFTGCRERDCPNPTVKTILCVRGRAILLMNSSCR